MKRSILFGIITICIGLFCIISVITYHFFYPKRYVKMNNGQYINIEAATNETPFPIDKQSTIIMEYYYMDEKRLLKEENVKIPDLYGCDKEGVLEYLKNYMVVIPKEEKDNGLVSFELTGYRNHEITLRKTYRKPNKLGYYAKSYNGTIVILRSDAKTVYEYTQIKINVLPGDLQEQVMAGYFLEDDEQLYNFLENYSS